MGALAIGGQALVPTAAAQRRRSTSECDAIVTFAVDRFAHGDYASYAWNMQQATWCYEEPYP